MFQTHWDENGQDTVEINGYSYPVVYSFLRWLYTDHVELPPDDAIGEMIFSSDIIRTNPVLLLLFTLSWTKTQFEIDVSVDVANQSDVAA